MALDYENTVYVSDRSHNRVQRYLRDIKTCMTIFGSSNGTADQTLSALNVPVTIILDSNDNLYIADADNHCVLMAGITGRIIFEKKQLI